ncbi:MAG: malto-oligosyltrehalose trehalohydrolase, partial [Actinobacteria bacterium]|nr:malto-oligosyltrehalose trehalohydrolase [Actinomycetota bacterium]
MSQRFFYELPFGAALRDRSRARFRLWAPAQNRVDLAIEGAAPQPMTAAGGWFEADIVCAPGARYRFQLQDGRRVADPASRFQPDDVHGPSAVVDPRAYQWRHERWSGRPWEE